MDKILMYTLREEDLSITANGLVNLILKNCVHITGHEVSRAKFAGGGITADGVQVTVKDRIRPGQTLRVALPEKTSSDEGDGVKVPAVPAPPGMLTILYEDEDVVVLDKPAGTVVHPTHGHWFDTLGNYLADYYEKQGKDIVCHVAGRLDMDTSGALVFAKNRASAGRLSQQRQEGIFKRTYHAIVHGVPGENDVVLVVSSPDENDGASDPNTTKTDKIFEGIADIEPSEKEEGNPWFIIDAPIERVPGMLMVRRVAADGGGERAVTHYRVISSGENTRDEIGDKTRYGVDESTEDRTGTALSLAEFHIDTGRTHQIRVHMSYIGHPLVGDPLYGDAELDRQQGYCPEKRRAMLHAISVEFLQPFTGEKISVKAPEPADFAALQKRIGSSLNSG